MLHYSNNLRSFIVGHHILSFHITISSFQDPPPPPRVLQVCHTTFKQMLQMYIKKKCICLYSVNARCEQEIKLMSMKHFNLRYAMCTSKVTRGTAIAQGHVLANTGIAGTAAGGLRGP